MTFHYLEWWDTCAIFRVRTLLSSLKFYDFPHDFLHDLFKFSKTLGLAVSFKKSKTFLVLQYFLTLNSSTDANSGIHQKCVWFVFNYSSLSYNYMVLAFSSAVSNLSNKTLIIIFYDFQGSTIKFHDFPGLENEIFKFHDFPGFPWPVQTLYLVS